MTLVLIPYIQVSIYVRSESVSHAAGCRSLEYPVGARFDAKKIYR